MKFTIESTHLDYLQNNGYIELHGLLSPAQTQELREALADSCAARAGKTSLEARRFSPLEIFLNGRDHWRENSTIERWVCRKQFADVAAELILAKHLRLACSQLIGSCQEPGIEIRAERAQESSLNSLCSIQGLMGAWIICLEEGPAPEEEEEEAEFDDIEGELEEFVASEEDEEEEPPVATLPHEVGSACFVLPDTRLPLEQLNQVGGGRYLIIAYGGGRSVYVHRSTDPLTHWLKSKGYVFGDRLNDATNPVLMR